MGEAKTGIKPMVEIECVGANLMFARRTKTGIKPMFENEFEAIASDIGSQTIVVRRANIRFAPTLISDIGWISITTIYPKIYDRLLNNLTSCKMKLEYHLKKILT
jgi:hypothetical protein